MFHTPSLQKGRWRKIRGVINSKRHGWTHDCARKPVLGTTGGKGNHTVFKTKAERDAALNGGMQAALQLISTFMKHAEGKLSQESSCSSAPEVEQR